VNWIHESGVASHFETRRKPLPLWHRCTTY
jgi:hypothetical protein